MADARVGQGVDVHAFGGEGPLVLGGVRVPGAPRLAGHSDGDVVLHAVVDAVLGAAGLGDIGDLVGVDDPAVAGASSRTFVAQAVAAAAGRGWRVVNADVTVIAQRPRLGPHRAAMATALTDLLDGAPVTVKATTTDRLGALGAGDGVAALAVVLLGPASH